MNGDRPAGDLRTHAERQGDALVELCPPGAGRRHAARRCAAQRAQVRVDHRLVRAVRRPRRPGRRRRRAALRRPDHAPRPPGGWPATPGWSRILTGPDGLPLDVGQEQRTRHRRDPPGHRAPRRALRLRRLHGPGRLVRRPPRRPLGATAGRPRCENGALLCERHHTAVHEGGFAHRPRPRHRRLAHLPPRRQRDPDPRAPSPVSSRASGDRPGTSPAGTAGRSRVVGHLLGQLDDLLLGERVGHLQGERRAVDELGLQVPDPLVQVSGIASGPAGPVGRCTVTSS